MSSDSLGYPSTDSLACIDPQNLGFREALSTISAALEQINSLNASYGRYITDLRIEHLEHGSAPRCWQLQFVFGLAVYRPDSPIRYA